MLHAQPVPSKSPGGGGGGGGSVPVRTKPINPELEDRYVSSGTSNTRLKSVSMDEFVLNTSAGSQNDSSEFPDLLGSDSNFGTISDQFNRPAPPQTSQQPSPTPAPTAIELPYTPVDKQQQLPDQQQFVVTAKRTHVPEQLTAAAADDNSSSAAEVDFVSQLVSEAAILTAPPVTAVVPAVPQQPQQQPFQLPAGTSIVATSLQQQPEQTVKDEPPQLPPGARALAEQSQPCESVLYIGNWEK